MAQSDIECANIALLKIGAPKLTSGTLSASTEETGIACYLALDPLKKALLRAHPWNFAVKRKFVEATLAAITNVTEDGSTGWFKIWSASTSGLSSGDGVTITDVVGCEAANGTWVCDAVVASTSFLLRNVDASGSYTSGGYWTEAGTYGYTHSIALPSDLLRVLRLNEESGDDYRIESGRVLLNSDEYDIKYIYDVTDYTLMDAEFYDLLSTRLALQICYKITQSSQMVSELKDTYKKQLAKVRFDDASEDPAETLEADEWINSRFSSGSWTNRIPDGV